jgi:DNA-binding protein HU-beta
MNKAELIGYVASEIGITKREAKNVVETVFNGLIEGLNADGKVTMVGFGSFVLVQRNARVARNPKTGEAVDVPAKVIPKFKPSATLKEMFEGFDLEDDGVEDEIEGADEVIDADEIA